MLREYPTPSLFSFSLPLQSFRHNKCCSCFARLGLDFNIACRDPSADRRVRTRRRNIATDVHHSARRRLLLPLPESDCEPITICTGPHAYTVGVRFLSRCGIIAFFPQQVKMRFFFTCRRLIFNLCRRRTLTICRQSNRPPMFRGPSRRACTPNEKTSVFCPFVLRNIGRGNRFPENSCDSAT